MASSAREHTPIIEKLEYNYLVNDDVTSLKTLISLLDETKFCLDSKKISKIKVYVLRNLRKYFWNLSNIDQIIECLDLSIGKDLIKFGYLLAIKAEFKAHFDKKNIDKLERKAIEYYGASFLFENNQIFTEDFQEVDALKNEFRSYIIRDKSLISKINFEVTNYADVYLKYKVLNLDINTNKQLAFDLDNIYTDDITLEQSNKINNKLVNYLYGSSVEIFADYYWDGLVKEVINRYQ